MSVITDKPHHLASMIKDHSVLTGGLFACAVAGLLAISQVSFTMHPDLEPGTQLSELEVTEGAGEGRFKRTISTGVENYLAAGAAVDAVSSKTRRNRIASLGGEGSMLGDIEWATSRTRR